MQRQCKRVRCQTCLSISQRVQPAFARSAKVRFFLSYYRQLLSTKCIEIVYSLLEKRKSIVVSFDFAGKKINYGKAISFSPSFKLYFNQHIYMYGYKVKFLLMGEASRNALLLVGIYQKSPHFHNE